MEGSMSEWWNELNPKTNGKLLMIMLEMHTLGIFIGYVAWGAR